MNLNDLTLDVEQTVEVRADIGDVFKGVLYRLGEGDTRPDGVSMDMTLEQWAGGRWFRDRGEGIQHLWGHVQVIKPPTLLEICGPLMMSYPAVNHVQYRFTPQVTGTRLAFVHRAMGLISSDHREDMLQKWGHWLEKIRERAEHTSTHRGKQ